MRWSILIAFLLAIPWTGSAEVVRCPDGSIYAGDQPETACGANAARGSEFEGAAKAPAPDPAQTAAPRSPSRDSSTVSLDQTFVDEHARRRCAERAGGDRHQLEICAAKEAHAVLRLNELIEETWENDRVGRIFMDCTERWTRNGSRLWPEILSCVESGRKKLASGSLQAPR